jgi:membrane protein
MDQPPRFGPSAARRADRPMGDLVRDLAAESSTLIRQAIAPARTEVRWNLRSLASGLTRLALGGDAPAADGASLRAATGAMAAAPPRTEERIGIVRRDGGAAGGRTEERRGGGDASAGLVKRVWTRFQEDDVLGEAAKVGFFAFMSLPPAILVIFALTGFFGGEGAATWLTENLQRALPEDAEALIDGFVTQVVHQQAPGPFSIGLVLALWAASAVFVSLAYALNRMYDTEETRSWIKLRAITLGVMLACVILLLGGAAMLIAGPAIAGALDLGGAADLAWAILQWPLAFLLVVAAFWIIYYVLPDRDQSVAKLVLLKSSAIAALLWVLATAGFRLYIANFGAYDETYGVLGGVIILLLWLYLTGIVILIGGELNSAMDESRA